MHENDPLYELNEAVFRAVSDLGRPATSEEFRAAVAAAGDVWRITTTRHPHEEKPGSADTGVPSHRSSDEENNMTDQTPVQTPDQTPVPVPATQIDAAGPESTPEGDGTGEQPNREMRYRLERNSAREELATANARLEQLLRADCERIAGERLSHPSDLFSLSGNSVSDYVTDGLVDLGKITADIEAILAERPGLRKLDPAVDYSQGSGNVEHKPTPKPTFGDLFK